MIRMLGLNIKLLKVSRYKNLQIEGEIGFLEWTSSAKGSVITDGADSHLVHNGLIVTQTIHYVVKPRELGIEKSK